MPYTWDDHPGEWEVNVGFGSFLTNGLCLGIVFGMEVIEHGHHGVGY